MITIIVLLILSGLTLTFVLGENGLFGKARQAKSQWQTAQEQENIKLSELESEMDSALISTRTQNPNEISFANSNMGGFVANVGTVSVNSYGITHNTFESGDEYYDYSSCIKNESKTLGTKFEISSNVFCNNETAADIGGIIINLYENNQLQLSINIDDYWNNYSSIAYLCFTSDSNVSIIKQGGSSTTITNASGRYGLVSDGSKLHLYWGTEELGSVDFTDEVSYDKIEIGFWTNSNYTNVAPMYIESLYIGEPYYYKDYISND